MFELQRPLEGAKDTTVQGPILKNCTLQDAAYIAHAANAYPKLVKALRQAIEDLAFPNQGPSGAAPAMERISALLRSLGEE
jgi:hypothetical protein